MLWFVGIQTAPLSHLPGEYRRMTAVEMIWRELLCQKKQYELEQFVSVHFTCIHVVSGCDPQMRTTALGYPQFLSDHSDL